MTMENPGHEENSRAADQVRQPAEATVPNPSRRRFTRAGVGASAVIMTLSGRSVLADTVCRSPSGFDSMPAASINAKDAQARCMGIGPSQWLQQNTWPINKEAAFASIFGTC